MLNEGSMQLREILDLDAMVSKGPTAEQISESENEDEAGEHEREPAHQRARRAAEPPRAVDRELRRRRPGQQVARRDRVLELDRRQPPPALDAEVAEERDVRRRAAEADAPEPPPLAQDGAGGRPHRRAA